MKLNKEDRSIDEYYSREFEDYFNTVINKRCEEELLKLGKAYKETYEKYITNNVEDENYIKKTKENIKYNYNK